MTPAAAPLAHISLALLMSTPRRTRSTRRANTGTPGEISVSSTASSVKPGVPWIIRKSFAQELENAFPLVHCQQDGNSLLSLIESGSKTQPVAVFLDDLIAQDPDNFSHFGARGSEIRSQIGDLVQHWKKKSKTEYQQRVVQRHKVVQVKGRIAKKKKAVLDEEELSDLSEEEDPLIGSTVAKTSKSAPATKQKQAPKRSFQAKTTMSSSFKVLDDGTLEGM